jgi:hypothetical protein
LAAAFFGVAAVSALVFFVPGVASFEMVRRERGFAAAVFFGFFMATVLATGVRVCWLRLSPGFQRRNGNLVFAKPASAGKGSCHHKSSGI